jgi:hypothetical protein
VEEHTKEKLDEALKQHFDGYKDTEIVSESVEGQWLFELLWRWIFRSIRQMLWMWALPLPPPPA